MIKIVIDYHENFNSEILIKLKLVFIFTKDLLDQGLTFVEEISQFR